MMMTLPHRGGGASKKKKFLAKRLTTDPTGSDLNGES